MEETVSVMISLEDLEAAVRHAEAIKEQVTKLSLQTNSSVKFRSRSQSDSTLCRDHNNVTTIASLESTVQQLLNTLHAWKVQGGDSNNLLVALS